MKQSKQIKKLLEFIKTKIKSNKKIFFLFDYDGVLVPIQDNPDTAFLPAKTRKYLLKLSWSRHLRVALVSGRALNKLKKLAKIRDRKIILVGSHGLEAVQNGKIRFLLKHDKKALEKIKSAALKVANNVAQGFLERKPYSVTYHIRDTRDGNLVKKLSREIYKLIKRKELDKKLKIIEGKNIIEIVSKHVSKGAAVEKIIKQYSNHLFFYFGDDITDISAFQAVKKKGGVTVSLNPKLNYKANFLITSKELINNLFYLTLQRF